MPKLVQNSSKEVVSLDLLCMLGIYATFCFLEHLHCLLGNLPVHFRLLWTVPGAFLCEEETVSKVDIFWEMLGCAYSIWQQCCPLHGERCTKVSHIRRSSLMKTMNSLKQN